ncbi:MAG: DNA ligase D [Vicinamibacterales bacterium]
MLEPMLATLRAASLSDPAFVYEPKYDGIRAIADVTAGGTRVRLWSRLGNEKTSQFPEVVEALSAWGRRRRESVVFDGEIVALDAAGRPAGFQQLQGRIHVRGMVKGRRLPAASGAPVARSLAPSAAGSVVPVAFVVFDVLKLGDLDLRPLPLTERRSALEKLLAKSATKTLRLSEQVRGDGRSLHARALAEGWEGLLAKRASSAYRSGKRSPDWCKLKVVHEQEFLIGGWTEPRQSRTDFGALLLGVHDHAPGARAAKAPLVYCGSVGTGFDQRELAKVMALLKPLETAEPPFSDVPATHERAHWVTPTLVAQVRFSEWTSDGVLRHPVYLGLRDDTNAAAVRREQTTPATRSASGRHAAPTASPAGDTLEAIVQQLADLEKRRKDGLLELPGGERLKVTNLHKVFWPELKLTKGDLFRYYVRVSPFILPVVADRALVMKRFPNGVAEKPFYQHNVEQAPQGVHLEAVESDDGREQIIGGTLLTLLYTAQLASISQDPWFSRCASLDSIDFIALDLDPADGVSFEQVRSVALWIRDELARLKMPNCVKTSGADGMHIYVPMPKGTPYDTGLLLAQIVATLVAERHPKEATIERSVRARGARVYVDYLQNIRGKTLACAYSARASAYAGVSTPLTWKEVERGVQREDFTIRTVPERLRDVGDLWKPLRESEGVDLGAVTRATLRVSPSGRP